MEGIPPARDTDAEDVVWGLQTADALWKRGERIDALVWLRRAAQAAGDANDDDRALELARNAAELTEWMANQPQVATVIPEAAPQAPSSQSIEVDVNMAESARQLPHFPPPPSEPPLPPAPQSAPQSARPMPPASRPPSQPNINPFTVATPNPFTPLQAIDDEPDEPTQQNDPRHSSQPEAAKAAEPAQARDDSESVLPAEKVHAGMFDPWADQAANMPEPTPRPMSPPTAAAPSRPPASVIPSVPPEAVDDEEEVVTSLRPEKLQQERSDVPPAPVPPAPVAPPAPAPSKPGPPRKPPPLPPRALQKPPVPTASAPSAPKAPSPPRPLAPSAPRVPVPRPKPAPSPPAPPVEAAPPPQPEPPAPSYPTPPPPTPPVERRDSDSTSVVHVPSIPPKQQSMPPPVTPIPPPMEAAPSEPAAPEVPPPAPPAEEKALELENVEPFGDLPDDARDAFARAAKVSDVAEGDEVSSFALAYIVNGSFDVAATVVDAPAVRLADGAVLRSRGTTEEGVPMRLICANGTGRVATWTTEAVEEAFRTCPWVEDDLRSAADRVQTLVGITIGPLGERLDASIREQIVGRLTLRPLGPSEIVVNAGEVVPGLLLVGVGELELVQGEKVSGTVGSGEFLFPTEVLGAGAAPATARAGSGGALIMFGDRKIAQELLVTCPPLLEVFAGM